MNIKTNVLGEDVNVVDTTKRQTKCFEIFYF